MDKQKSTATFLGESIPRNKLDLFPLKDNLVVYTVY